MEGKAFLNSRVDSELLKRFKRLALQKHGKLRGCLEIELEKAVRDRVRRLEKELSEIPGK